MGGEWTEVLQPLGALRQGFGGLSASQATCAVALIRIHPWVNPWSSAKADKWTNGSKNPPQMIGDLPLGISVLLPLIEFHQTSRSRPYQHIRAMISLTLETS